MPRSCKSKQNRTKKTTYIGQNKKGKMTIKDAEYTTQKTKTPNNTNSIENMG
jgi:hypothetical protein